MAGLETAQARAQSPIPASQQFKAIAWLRWRLFVNGFRRKGGTGELVARIIVFPFAALFVIGPLTGALIGSYYVTSKGHLGVLTAIFWGIFALQILVSINISQPGLSFDPESLIRFPLAFSRYLLIRLFLGLLSASTVVGTLALLAAAAGTTYARPDLGLTAFAVALSLALCNMLFIRMVFAWLDRWLSTRRARELFTGLIFAFSLGIQYLNVTFNGLGKHTSHAARQAKIDAVQHLYSRVEPYLHLLPPGLAGGAIAKSSAGAPLAALAFVGGILLFAVICLAIFAWRMQREYRGENLSEAAKSTPQPATPRAAANVRTPQLQTTLPTQQSRTSFISPVAIACFEKEWITVRRNPTQLYGLIVPIAMVFILRIPLSRFSNGGMIFPVGVAYSILGIAALSYNVLGLDAAGIQFYFMAPIAMRNVMLGKNLFGFAITAIQVALVYPVLAFSSGPPGIFVTLSTVCWAVFAILVNATVGNMRSITAPKKIDPSKISRKQASQLSALMCFGIMAVLAGVGAATIGLSTYIGKPWLPIPILLALAIGAFALYSAGLNRSDSIALNHRESLIEELCKAG